MKRFGTKSLFIVIGVILLTIVIVARLHESSSLERTAREYFDLSDLIERYSVITPLVGNNAPVIVADVNEREWREARSRLLHYFGAEKPVDSIDGPVRKAIIDRVGDRRLKNVLVFAKSDPIDGVIYCVIGRSKEDGPILFFVVQRI